MESRDWNPGSWSSYGTVCYIRNAQGIKFAHSRYQIHMEEKKECVETEREREKEKGNR